MALHLKGLGFSLGDGVVDGILRGAQQGGLSDHAWRQKEGKGWVKGVKGNWISLAYEGVTLLGASGLELLGHEGPALDATVYGSGALLASHLIALA
ncbi:MAG: hypothetical protein ACREN4_07180 [Candidatus Dormibacteria bacterium]